MFACDDMNKSVNGVKNYLQYRSTLKAFRVEGAMAICCFYK